MRKYPILITKAEMRLVNNLLLMFLEENKNIHKDMEKMIERLLYVLREQEL